jgi:CTP synthase (UTP-ammonia lyase)
MNRKAIAIVADFNRDNESHLATNHAIGHALAALGSQLDVCWIGTDTLSPSDPTAALAHFSGLWIGPASPYKNADGALAAIRLARERRIPLLGTCGGFQHIMLEHARNVVGMADADHEETNPQASTLVISRLACSLVGRSMTVTLKPGSRVASLYGQPTTQERYLCNFGVNPAYADRLISGELRVAGSDAEGVVRVVELAGHPFFVGTLFLPQLTSKPDLAHPIVSGFLRACLALRRFP